MTYDLILVLSASLFIALCAQIVVPLPVSPVPLTGQTLAVLLVGTLLGRRRGSLAVIAYIAEGLGGLPVFAHGGFGPAHLLGPTGGYLIGFVAAAYVTGALAERGWDRGLLGSLAAMCLGNLAIYAVGLSWLSLYAGDATLVVGLYPFLIADAIKIVLAGVLLPSTWNLLN
jgi:biotin transport system substrate-specific component